MKTPTKMDENRLYLSTEEYNKVIDYAYLKPERKERNALEEKIVKDDLYREALEFILETKKEKGFKTAEEHRMWLDKTFYQIQKKTMEIIKLDKYGLRLKNEEN